jgi:hypothetical protein
MIICPAVALAVILAAQPPTISGTADQTAVAAATAALAAPVTGGIGSRVPAGETYVTFNSAGRQTGKFGGGTPLHMAATDCVQIKCPKVIAKAGGKVRCWRCGKD